MNDKPLVSVVMITYGHEKYICDALNGVFIQNYDGPIELIIANDNSPDKTDEVIKEYLSTHPAPKNLNIRYTKHEQNKGMMPNFIWALEQANGKYIALCEGDDYWTDNLKLQKQVDFLEKNEDYVLTFHPVNILKTDGKLERDYLTKVPENYEVQEALLKYENYIHTPSVVFRNIITNYPIELSWSPIGDYLLYIILSYYGKFKQINDSLAVYRYGVGFFRKETRINRVKKSLLFYTLAISSLSDPESKKIMIDRQLYMIDHLQDVVKEETQSRFVKIFLKLKGVLSISFFKSSLASIINRKTITHEPK